MWNVIIVNKEVIIKIIVYNYKNVVYSELVTYAINARNSDI